MARYVNIKKDSAIAIYPSKLIASQNRVRQFVNSDNPFNSFDGYETVRILNEQEEKEFAWEWYKRAIEGAVLGYTANEIDRNIFEEDWKNEGEI